MSADAPDPDQVGHRPALQWLASRGAFGAMLALFLLRAEAWAPLAALKSKLFPFVLLCCAEVSWLFGGGVGLLVAAQWLVHELAHVHAAQKIGLKPGWRSLIPFIGVYAATPVTAYQTRENEVRVALSGILAGLTLATVLYGYGLLTGSDMLVTAARIGFALNLINLLPFRPFDGGRIFPGFLWRMAGDPTGQPADAASLRFIEGCRKALSRISGAAARQDGRTIVTEAIVASILMAALVAGVGSLILPPLALGLLMLIAIAMIAALIAAIVEIDPAALATGPAVLQPRRGAQMPSDIAVQPLPWRDGRAARTALAIYGVALVAALAGSLV